MQRFWLFSLLTLLSVALVGCFPTVKDSVESSQVARSEDLDENDGIGEEPRNDFDLPTKSNWLINEESVPVEEEHATSNIGSKNDDDSSTDKFYMSIKPSTKTDSGTNSEPVPVEPTASVDNNEYIDSFVRIAEGAMRIEHNGIRALRYFRAAAILGHFGALTAAASLLISGEIGVQRDVSSAVRYLRIASSHGHADAQAFMGMLHGSGLAERYGVQKSTAMALLYWEFASQSGSTYASTALGYRYHTGIDVVPNCETAARHYFVAAKEIARDPNTWPSWRNFVYGPPPLPSKLKDSDVRRLDDEDFARLNRHDKGAADNLHSGAGGGGGDAYASEKDVLEYYKHSAKRGNLEAQTTIGALQYYGGHGMQRDEALAEATLRQAATAGSGDANAMLAHIRMRRGEAPATVLSLLERAASLGNKDGHYGLGMVYLYGLLGNSTDYPHAIQHFQLAMDLRHAEAAFHLGRMHSKGLGVEKSRLEAFRHFQHGARLGNVQSEYALGVYFLHGLGPVGQSDCKSAVPYLKRVAEKGDWKAVLDRGLLNFHDGDTFGGLWRFVQAAQVGIELGQYNAAMLFEHAEKESIEEIGHWERSRLIDESRVLYHMSAQEYSPAWVRSGNVAYLHQKDFESAVWSYEKGNKIRNAEASFCLGWMYVRGLGVPRDRNMAMRYINAAKESNPEAVVPATVAAIALKTWWMLRDVAVFLGLYQYVEERIEKFMFSMWEFADNPELYSPSSAGKLNSFAQLVGSSSENQDAAIVIGLLAALFMVTQFRRRGLQSLHE